MWFGLNFRLPSLPLLHLVLWGRDYLSSFSVSVGGNTKLPAPVTTKHVIVNYLQIKWIELRTAKNVIRLFRSLHGFDTKSRIAEIASQIASHDLFDVTIIR